MSDKHDCRAPLNFVSAEHHLKSNVPSLHISCTRWYHWVPLNHNSICHNLDGLLEIIISLYPAGAGAPFLLLVGWLAGPSFIDGRPIIYWWTDVLRIEIDTYQRLVFYFGTYLLLQTPDWPQICPISGHLYSISVPYLRKSVIVCRPFKIHPVSKSPTTGRALEVPATEGFMAKDFKVASIARYRERI